MTYVKKGSTGLTLLIIGAVFFLVLVVFDSLFVPILYGYHGYIAFIRLFIEAIPAILFLVGFVMLNKEFKERTYTLAGQPQSYLSAAPVQTPMPTRFCPSCDSQIPQDASFCPSCGKKFSERTKQS